MKDDFVFQPSTTLVRYIGIESDVRVPPGVLEIADSAFSGDFFIHGVTLPDGIVKIAASAFEESALAKINLPSTLKEIEECAFSDSKLIRIWIPGSIKLIDHAVFQNCKDLRGVVIDNNVETIAADAFAGCSNLVSITVPDSIRDIDARAFTGCTSLREVRASEQWKQNHPSLLHRILVNSSVQVRAKYLRGHADFHIVDDVLMEYWGSMETVTVPESVTTISPGAFLNCRSLKKVILPNVRKIGESAFECCSNLEEVIFSEATEEIGWYAFQCCPNLTHIDLPPRLTKLGDNAFQYCGLFSVTIPGTVKVVKNSCFYDIRNLAEIILREGVETIEGFAFSGAGLPVAVTIPDTVTSIDKYAFRNTRIRKVIVSGKWANQNPGLIEILESRMLK